MYHAFKAIVSKGKIKPLEKVKLKDSQLVVVTLVDEEPFAEGEWKKLKKWITQQRKEKKFKSYSTLQDIKRHLSQLSKP